MAHLFVLDLTYTSGLDLVELHMEAHRAYLKEHYATGTFLASGRKEPRVGGVILAQGERTTIEEIIASDPFAVSGAAAYHVTEFLPTMTAAALEHLQEATAPASASSTA